MRKGKAKAIFAAKQSEHGAVRHGRGKAKPLIPPAIRDARHAKDYLDDEEAQEEVKQWPAKKKKL